MYTCPIIQNRTIPKNKTKSPELTLKDEKISHNDIIMAY